MGLYGQPLSPGKGMRGAVPHPEPASDERYARTPVLEDVPRWGEIGRQLSRDTFLDFCTKHRGSVPPQLPVHTRRPG